MNLPMMPGIISIGMYMTIVVIIAKHTGTATSRTPAMAAASGFMPCCLRI